MQFFATNIAYLTIFGLTLTYDLLPSKSKHVKIYAGHL